MKMTISFVELIAAIILDVNRDNTRVYLHETLELRKLEQEKSFELEFNEFVGITWIK